MRGRPDVILLAGDLHQGRSQVLRRERPRIERLTTAPNVPRAVGAGGLHALDGRRIYVSRGVGVERN